VLGAKNEYVGASATCWLPGVFGVTGQEELVLSVQMQGRDA
jgi:hypothetical protein